MKYGAEIRIIVNTIYKRLLKIKTGDSSPKAMNTSKQHVNARNLHCFPLIVFRFLLMHPL